MDTTKQNGNGSDENPVPQQSEVTQVVEPLRIVAPTSDSEVKKTRGLYKWLLLTLLILLSLLGLLAMIIMINLRVGNLEDGARTIEKDVTEVKMDVQKLKTATANLITANNMLTGQVEKAAVTSDQLVEETKKLAARVDGMETTKIDRKELSGLATTNYLRRVERKLDAHISIVAKETTPLPTEEKTFAPTASQPTHNVRYRPVPVYIDVYKPRSAR